MGAAREILITVAGLTPQIITETLYYLTQLENPPVRISEIFVLTTLPGKERIQASLLDPARGHVWAFCHEYGIDPSSITFDAASIVVLQGNDEKPLRDIRTDADNGAVADQIAAFIRRLTDDPTTRLHCSLAGGRKTQSVLLGFALQLYGRPQDRLLHVLISEEFESHPEFFYPTRKPRHLRTRDGRRIDAHNARLDVAEIPYLRLREKLFQSGGQPTVGFQPTIQRVQRTLDSLPTLPSLVIMCHARCIRIGGIEIRLEPLELVLYAQLARARVEQAGRGDGFLTLAELDAMRDAMLRRYEGLYGPYSGHVEALRARWKEGIPPPNLRSHFAAIKQKIQAAILDSVRASFYQVTSERRYAGTRYGLTLPPEKIEVWEDER